METYSSLYNIESTKAEIGPLSQEPLTASMAVVVSKKWPKIVDLLVKWLSFYT